MTLQEAATIAADVATKRKPHSRHVLQLAIAVIDGTSIDKTAIKRVRKTVSVDDE